MSSSKKIILTIHKCKYDVTNFDHPGEGICGAYIRYFTNKDVTKSKFRFIERSRPFHRLYI
jgi:cytochrome b involved in lipid metabolism